MAQSPEFPELPWVPPRSWTSGRTSGQPTVVVIHSTEGSEGTRSAEDGAAYDQRRTDGTSTHFFVDADSVIQCVKTTDRAHHARATGNRIGIGFELCGRAGQTSVQWHDAASLPMLPLAAKYVAKCCRKYGLPVRRLTVAQLREGQKGICGHVDITAAFGESTHTDPGPNFPWTEFLDLVQAELTPQPAEEDMNAEQARQLHNLDRLNSALLGGQTEVSSLLLQNGDVVALPLAVAVQAKDAARDAAAARAIVTELRDRPTPAVTDEQLERVLRKVLGSVDGVSPA